MRKISTSLLFIANWILLGTAWFTAIYAYSHLPEKIPLWLNFFGEQSIMMKKSPLFFIYPSAQTLFLILFFIAYGILSLRKTVPGEAGNLFVRKDEKFLFELSREFLYLILIFFNLIFIHIQTTLIFLAHQAEKGFNKFYFFSLFAIILILIPFYRMRKKMILRKIDRSRISTFDV